MRTTVDLNQRLLQKALAITKATKKATIEIALDEFVRREKTKDILALSGSGAWQGSLNKMRSGR